jgi:tripartite ATP-independent transporter DctM subunit
MTEAGAAPVRGFARAENAVLAAILAAMAMLPVAGVVGRSLTDNSIAAVNVWVQNLNLCLAFLGAVVAARTGKHLNLSTAELFKLSSATQRRIAVVTSAIATAVTATLAVAAFQFVQAERSAATVLPGGVPQWVIQAAMPIGFGGMAIYLALTGSKTWGGRIVSLLAACSVPLLGLVEVGHRTPVVWLGGILLTVAVGLGAPIYTVMGGLAMLLFYGQPLPTPISAVPLETFTLVASPTLPAIPLFTLAGYLLAEGGASKRLVGLFQRFFGWLPGGIAAAAVLVCAFFTTFTGASGVTILALGGLLLPILRNAGYEERFSIGLLIASGSIGLLFPPSLPVILYGVVSHVPIDTLFVAGFVPGVLLVVLVAGMGVIHAAKRGVKRVPFELKPAISALWDAKWEVALPVLVLSGIFGGFLTIFEAAACTAAYAVLTEVVIHRDLSIGRDVPRVLVECGTLMGGVLIILGVALGLTNFLVDAEVPMRMSEWTEAHVGSRAGFLLLLNLLLLVVGCLMDIFSATVVVVPLIVPIAAVFDVNPAHLGIIFLANLELGYLTPPVGMNLFLASYRFEKPLTEVWRMGAPFLAVLLGGVLLITYAPAMTLWSDKTADAGSSVDFESQLGEPGVPGAATMPPGEATPPLPLGNLNLDALLADDDDSAK